MRRIGVMLSGDASDPFWRNIVSSFVGGLQKLGWIEGTNLVIEYRWGGNDVERVRHYAAELLDQYPEVIWALGALPALSLKRATHTVPIVFTQVVDPVGSGFVASLARPGGNLTGFTMGEFSQGGKMLEVLKEIAPKLNRVAVILNLDQPPIVALYYTIEMLAPSIGIRPTAADVQNPADVERAVQAFASEPNGGLIVLATPITVAHRELTIALAARHHLPAIYFYRIFVTAGGLASYSADLVEQTLEGAGYVDRILKGEKPADLPVQAPTKYELVINFKTAKALGLVIPPSVLARADEVIE
jgi:putative ABC transport system substrate-binding protein